ncbi:MAG: hypothetical protein ACLRQX_02075 [Turicibacter sanguinis]
METLSIVCCINVVDFIDTYILGYDFPILILQITLCIGVVLMAIDAF